jgi:hypothetical protein
MNTLSRKLIPEAPLELSSTFTTVRHTFQGPMFDGPASKVLRETLVWSAQITTKSIFAMGDCADLEAIDFAEHDPGFGHVLLVLRLRIDGSSAFGRSEHRIIFIERSATVQLEGEVWRSGVIVGIVVVGMLGSAHHPDDDCKRKRLPQPLYVFGV